MPAAVDSAPRRPERIELPGVLGEIARLTTVEVAVAVAKSWGGTRLYLPHEPRSDHQLARVIGVKPARIICRKLGGRRHDIPSARPALRWAEARRLREEEKLSHAEIALRLGITMGHARQLCEGIEFAASGGPRHIRVLHCPICGKRRTPPYVAANDPRQLLLPLP
jgi:hypothetical protein